MGVFVLFLTGIALAASEPATHSSAPAKDLQEPGPTTSSNASVAGHQPESKPIRSVTDTNIALVVPNPPSRRELSKPAEVLSLASTNIQGRSESDLRQEGVKVFDTQLAIARQQRREREYALAKQTYVGLLESAAPDNIQQTAMLELAGLMEENNDLVQAQQILSQFNHAFPNDQRGPEVLLRQGLIYRKMGATTMALGKFYAVMSSALSLQADHYQQYQQLVLQAQTEIADTNFSQGRYNEAAEFYQRILKLENTLISKATVQYKLIRSLAQLAQHTDIVIQAQEFVERFPESPELPEVRFLLATSLKQTGHNREALQQVLTLLESQSSSAAQSPDNWAYWQQRTGNDIANQMYREGDYANALVIYQHLAQIDSKPSWQFPVLYQVGLVYERLNHTPKAIETYNLILSREKELQTNASPTLQTVLEMAKWRKDMLGWSQKAEKNGQDLRVSLPTPITPEVRQ